jgi:WD40 repeat protein
MSRKRAIHLAALLAMLPCAAQPGYSQPLGKEKTFRDHADTVKRVAFSPDGQRIVSAAKDKRRQDNTVKVWDVASISPDGKTILSGSWDKTLKLWRLPPSMPWPRQTLPSTCHRATFAERVARSLRVEKSEKRRLFLRGSE